MNACIRFLPTLDGKALLTVEDLAARRRRPLHPVQQAHGRLPRLAMRLLHAGLRDDAGGLPTSSHSEAGTAPTRQQLADELSGNLCRCTGYRPILDAGQRMFELPRRRLDTAPLVALLQQLRADPPLHYAAPNLQSLTAARRTTSTRRARWTSWPRCAPSGRRRALLAGATDIGLWVNKQFRDLGDIDLRRRGGRTASASHAADGALHIGAARLAGRRLVGAGRALARAATKSGCALPARRCAMPARWAATSPTARPSATARRC